MASLAPSSRTLYANSMGRLQQFALSVADVQTWFPASVSLICLFIAHLLDSGLAPATVWSTLSGIAFFHKLFRVADPTGDFLVKRLMLGASKVHPSCEDRLPITIPILHVLCDSTDHITRSAYAARLVRAMFLLMFHAFLRIGEVTKSHNNIMLSQLSVLPECAVLVFHHAKHLVGPAVSISVPASGGPYCPITNLNDYLVMRGSSPGPLFSLPDMQGIQANQFNAWLNQSLSYSSLASLPIKSHRFRIGSATYAATVGYTESQIQQMGRWKSSAFKKYIRITSFKTV